MSFDHEDVTVLILVFVIAVLGATVGIRWEVVALGATGLYSLYLIGKGRD